MRQNLIELMRGFDGNVRVVKAHMTKRIKKLQLLIPTLEGRKLSAAKKELRILQRKRTLLNGFPPEANRKDKVHNYRRHPLSHS